MFLDEFSHPKTIFWTVTVSRIFWFSFLTQKLSFGLLLFCNVFGSVFSFTNSTNWQCVSTPEPVKEWSSRTGLQVVDTVLIINEIRALEDPKGRRRRPENLVYRSGARLFLNSGASLFRSTNPPGGWGGTLRSYGYKHCIGKFYGYKPYDLGSSNVTQ